MVWVCIVFMLSFRFTMEIVRVGGSGLSERGIHDIIDVKISRFMREDSPGLISIVRNELISAMGERLRILWGNLEDGRLRTHYFTFKEFDSCGAPHFFDSRDPIINMCWITMWRVPFVPALSRRKPRSDLRHVFCSAELWIGDMWLFRTSNLKFLSLCHGRTFFIRFKR